MNFLDNFEEANAFKEKFRNGDPAIYNIKRVFEKPLPQAQNNFEDSNASNNDVNTSQNDASQISNTNDSMNNNIDTDAVTNETSQSDVPESSENDIDNEIVCLTPAKKVFCHHPKLLRIKNADIKFDIVSGFTSFKRNVCMVFIPN